MFRLFWCAVHLLCSVCLCLCLCLYLIAPRVIAEVCLGVGLVGDSAGRVPASCDGLLTRSGSHWADAGGQAASRDVNLGRGVGFCFPLPGQVESVAAGLGTCGRRRGSAVTLVVSC